MTLVIRSDPPLLVTHLPLTEVPDGCVNVHGHEHGFKPLRQGRWINVSVEQTVYRPLDVRRRSSPWRRLSSPAGYRRGSRRPNGCGTRASRESDRDGLKHRRKSDADGLGTAGMAGRPHRPGKPS